LFLLIRGSWVRVPPRSPIITNIWIVRLRGSAGLAARRPLPRGAAFFGRDQAHPNARPVDLGGLRSLLCRSRRSSVVQPFGFRRSFQRNQSGENFDDFSFSGPDRGTPEPFDLARRSLMIAINANWANGHSVLLGSRIEKSKRHQIYRKPRSTMNLMNALDAIKLKTNGFVAGERLARFR
jgi:hypothetical protein